MKKRTMYHHKPQPLARYKANNALVQKMVEYCKMLLKEAHNSRLQADFLEEEVQKILCSHRLRQLIGINQIN
eukprot:4613360-Ditylum_brightwellii.AAC.1